MKKNNQGEPIRVRWLKRALGPGKLPFLALLFAAIILALPVGAGAWAETYTSNNSRYPGHFKNTQFDTEHNDMQGMTSVNFGGREIIFFTLISTFDTTYNQYLYYYTPDTPENDDYDDYYKKLDINNSANLNFRIKACVFNDTLYVFYSTSYAADSSYPNTKIYYRTATVDTGSDGTDYTLTFSDEKSFSAGVVQAAILYAAEMNGSLYVHFADHHDQWYVSTSTDGETFSSATAIHDCSGTLYGPDGTVFPVVDAEGNATERMMLAYAPTGGATLNSSYIKYFFFDGESAYGEGRIDTDGLYPQSVRLSFGTVTGYTASYLPVQVFIASAGDDGTDEQWSQIYHTEYIPAGENGDEGTWPSPWSCLSDSDDDHVHCYSDYDSDQRWAVTTEWIANGTTFNKRMVVRYALGTDFSGWHIADQTRFRSSRYSSDYFEYTGAVTTAPGALTDLSACIVIGVIDGTPPFPVNGGDLGGEAANTSVARVSDTLDGKLTTSWSAGCSAMVSYGKQTPIIGASLKLAGAFKYTNSTQTSSSTTTTDTFRSYTHTTPGDDAWLLVFKPEIINTEYTYYSADGQIPTYQGDTSGTGLSVHTITFGESSTVEAMPYYIDDPSYPFGGTNTYTEILEGMTARPLSSDIAAWADLGTELQSTDHDDIYTCTPLTDAALSSCVGAEETVSVVSSVTEGETYSGSLTLTASAKILGFSSEESVSFSVDFSTQTTMTESLGFSLHLPDCCDDRYEDCTGLTCYASADVQPVLLVAADDDSGYDAPWISDDIRANNKPKPWCLSYLVTVPKTTSLSNFVALSLSNASAILRLDPAHSSQDRISAELEVTGLKETFSLEELNWLHFRIKDYVINSDRNTLLSRSMKGKTLVLEFTEKANPDALIRLTFSYDKDKGKGKFKSRLTIDVEGQGLDLSGFNSTSLPSKNLKNRVLTVPLVLSLGSDHYAKGTLDVRVEGGYAKPVHAPTKPGRPFRGSLDH